MKNHEAVRLNLETRESSLRIRADWKMYLTRVRALSLNLWLDIMI